jgi:hypothetical protein
MVIEKLKGAHEARPFKPFTICLADGRQVAVPSPEFLWIPPQASRTFWVSRGGEEMLVDLLMVVSIDYRGGRSARRKAG